MTTALDWQLVAEARCQAAELLAGYLLDSPWLGGPGTDGITVVEVIETAYGAAVLAGHVPGRDELIRRHADLADAIMTFFPTGVLTSLVRTQLEHKASQ